MASSVQSRQESCGGPGGISLRLLAPIEAAIAAAEANAPK
jgi:hypothetical protein